MDSRRRCKDPWAPAPRPLGPQTLLKSPSQRARRLLSLASRAPASRGSNKQREEAAQALPGPSVRGSGSTVALAGPSPAPTGSPPVSTCGARLAALVPGTRTACGDPPLSGSRLNSLQARRAGSCSLGPRLQNSVPGSQFTKRPQPRAGQWRAGGDQSVPAGTGETTQSRGPQPPGRRQVLARGLLGRGCTAQGA